MSGGISYLNRSKTSSSRLGFNNSIRSRDRSYLFNDLIEVVDRYSMLENEDLVFTINMVRHKIIENNGGE